MQMKRPDAVHLHGGGLGGLAKNGCAFGKEGVAAGAKTLQLRAIKFRPRAQADIPGQNRDVLIDGMSMRRNEAAAQLTDTHHKFLAFLIDVALDHHGIFIQRRERDILCLPRVSHRCSKAAGHQAEDQNQRGNQYNFGHVHRSTSTRAAHFTSAGFSGYASTPSPRAAHGRFASGALSMDTGLPMSRGGLTAIGRKVGTRIPPGFAPMFSISSLPMKAPQGQFVADPLPK